MNKYTIHTAIKCTDGNVHRLSYDLTRQTEGSVNELSHVLAEIENRFPDVQFWLDQYPEKATDNFIRIHGTDIKESLKVENAVRQSGDPITPSDLGLDY